MIYNVFSGTLNPTQSSTLLCAVEILAVTTAMILITVTTTWHSHLTKGRIAPHTNSSIIFNRRHQHALHLTNDSLGPPQSISQTAYRSVQPFLHSSRHNVRIGPPLSPSKLILLMEDLDPHRSTWFLGSTRVHNLDGISIGSAVFAGLTIVTDRQTTLVLYGNRSYLRTWFCDAA